MVNNRLIWVLESKDLLASEQCGFMKTVALQIIWFVLIVTFVMFLPRKEHILAIFFDLVKAYDTTWKHCILSDLYNLDFRGYLPTFIDGFLPHRLFQEMGVPHGTILSPVPFSLKIDNIVSSVLKGSEASLFVNDFALCIRAKSLLHAQRLMQPCVNSVQGCVSNNGFKFSTSNTVCMHFYNQREHFAEPSILFDKNPINVVAEAKFLGIIFDRTLSYNSHVNYMKTNGLKALDIF